MRDVRLGATSMLGLTALLAGLVGACGSDAADRSATRTIVALPDAAPGDVISLRSDGTAVEWIDRRAGTIERLADSTTGDTGIDTVATIAVSTDGEQRGLLGTTVIDGRRFAAWTDPTSLDLLVGEIVDGAVDRIVWDGTTTRSKAIGGHLGTLDGRIVLGLGELTGWGEQHGSGALVLLEPDGAATQEPIVLSDGWNNPFAFVVVAGSTVWIADNAPDGGPEPERLGRLDLPGHAVRSATPGPQRAPSAIVVLPDGRLGVCGFLDGEMWAFDPAGVGSVDTIEPEGSIGPCLTGATVADDGTIVTATEAGLVAIG